MTSLFLQFKCIYFLFPALGSWGVFHDHRETFFFNDCRHLMHLQNLPQSLIMFFLEVRVKANMFI